MALTTEFDGRRPTRPSPARGFSLVEVIVAMVILVIGLVSLAALFGQAIGTMQLVQEDLIVKQKARETLESIYTARNTQQVTFDMIRNVSDVSVGGIPGIFADGFQPLRQPGGDGLAGTADDGAVEELVLPGPDGLLGTLDDDIRSLGTIEREIVIQPIVRADGTVNPDLRQITINFRYAVAQGPQRTYRVGSYISRFR